MQMTHENFGILNKVQVSEVSGITFDKQIAVIAWLLTPQTQKFETFPIVSVKTW